VIATYATGSAQLVLTQAGQTETIQLTRVGRGSTLDNFSGAAVGWRSDDGWVLQVMAYEFGAVPPNLRSPAPTSSATEVSGSYSGDITIQLIADHEFWTATSWSDSGNRCIVDIEDATATLIKGSATCRGLKWADGAAPANLINPVYIEGEEPFDAEITFEARP